MTVLKKNLTGEKIMPYTLKIPEKDVTGEDKFINASGETQCVIFVQQAAKTPLTKEWRPGIHIMTSKPGEIDRGTAIATFDEHGRYPTKGDKHAAIYLSHNSMGIRVLDQWATKGKKGIPHEVPGVSDRTIHANKPKNTRLSNRAEMFYVIED